MMDLYNHVPVTGLMFLILATSTTTLQVHNDRSEMRRIPRFRTIQGVTIQVAPFERKRQSRVAPPPFMTPPQFVDRSSETSRAVYQPNRLLNLEPKPTSRTNSLLQLYDKTRPQFVDRSSETSRAVYQPNRSLNLEPKPTSRTNSLLQLYDKILKTSYSTDSLSIDETKTKASSGVIYRTQPEATYLSQNENSSTFFKPSLKVTLPVFDRSPLQSSTSDFVLSDSVTETSTKPMNGTQYYTSTSYSSSSSFLPSVYPVVAISPSVGKLDKSIRFPPTSDTIGTKLTSVSTLPISPSYTAPGTILSQEKTNSHIQKILQQKHEPQLQIQTSALRYQQVPAVADVLYQQVHADQQVPVVADVLYQQVPAVADVLYQQVPADQQVPVVADVLSILDSNENNLDYNTHLKQHQLHHQLQQRQQKYTIASPQIQQLLQHSQQFYHQPSNLIQENQASNFVIKEATFQAHPGAPTFRIPVPIPSAQLPRDNIQRIQQEDVSDTSGYINVDDQPTQQMIPLSHTSVIHPHVYHTTTQMPFIQSVLGSFRKAREALAELISPMYEMGVRLSEQMSYPTASNAAEKLTQDMTDYVSSTNNLPILAGIVTAAFGTVIAAYVVASNNTLGRRSLSGPGEDIMFQTAANEPTIMEMLESATSWSDNECIKWFVCRTLHVSVKEKQMIEVQDTVKELINMFGPDKMELLTIVDATKSVLKSASQGNCSSFRCISDETSNWLPNILTNSIDHNYLQKKEKDITPATAKDWSIQLSDLDN